MESGRSDSSRFAGSRQEAEEDQPEAVDEVAWLARFPQENPNPILRVSAEGTVLYRNPAAAGIPGWNRDVGQILPAPVLPLVGRAMVEGRTVEADVELGDKWYAVWLAPFPQECYANVYARDITDGKRVEALLESRLRLSELSQTADAAGLMQAALDEAERLTGSQIGFFHFVDADQENLTLQAWSTNTLKNLCQAEGQGLHYPISTAGVWVDCFHARAPVIHNDYPSLPHRKGLPQGHAPVVREMAVPIVRGGVVVAIMGVGNKPADYGQRDVDTLQALAVPVMDLVARKGAEEALRHSEQRLAMAMEAAQQAPWDCDLVTDTVNPSPRMCELYGVTDPEALRVRADWRSFVVEEDLPSVLSAMDHADPRTGGYVVEYRIRRRSDGAVRWMACHGRVHRDAEGRPVRLVGVIADITERKRREARIARLTKLYAVLSRVNEAIVRLHSEEELLAEVCRVVAEVGEFPLVWIGRVEGRMVAPAASAGAGADYLKTFRVEIDGHLGQGPTGTCVREDRPVINDDFDTNPATAPWRGRALKHGFRASAAFPLRRGGNPVGALTLYASQPGAFDEEQVDLLEALAADVSYALGSLQQERLREAAESAMLRSVQRFGLLADTAGALLGSRDPQASVESLCRTVMEHLDSQVFFNFLVDEEAGRLHLNACAGISPQEAVKIEWLDFGVAVCGCAARDACPVVAERIPATPDPRTELVKSLGVRAYACHPLLGPGGKVIGTLSFGTRNRETFSEEDLSLMKAVADQVAVAVARMQAENALRQARDELEARVRERTEELARTVETLQEEAARRELAETTLWQRSKILDAFFRHSVTPLVILDRRFHFIRVNDAYARACQRDVSDFPGRNHFEFYPDPENQAIFADVVATQKPHQALAKPFSFPDHPEWGVTYWDWTLTPLLDDAGEVGFLVFSLEDVTRRTLADQKARAAALYARSLIEASLDPLVTISPEGKITDVNQATEEATGAARHALIGKDFSDFFTDPQRARQGYRKVLEEGQVRDYPLTVRRPFGGTLDVLYHATVYRGEDGKVQGVFAAARDVTDRKRAEEELRRSHEELRQKAEQLRELASELTLTEQRERQRMAQVLHDHLQQLLVGAKFQMMLLRRVEALPLRRAADTVDDLLSQSIEVSRNLTAELSPPILHEGGLAPALEWLVLWMKEKHGLSVDLRAEGPSEPASEELSVLLFQSARELLFNVVKHAGVKQAAVRLACRDGEVLLEIADGGKGFDPGRLHGGRAGAGGFGLFSIRQRLELLGGSFGVQSAPGQGSRFTLRAPGGARPAGLPPPAGEEHAPRIDTVAAAGSEAGSLSAAGADRRIRVLIADDHLIVRQGLARLLREEPDIVVVGEASDGREAVQQARRLRPDVVVMDVSMPDMGGAEATRLIRAQRPQTSVVGLSMFEEAERSAAMRQAGAAAYLSKSGPAEEVVAAIRSCAVSATGSSRKRTKPAPARQRPPRNPRVPRKARRAPRKPAK